MPTSSGFTLTEVLISASLLCVTGMGAITASLVAKRQLVIATQHTLALSVTAELSSRIGSHHYIAEDYQGNHPLWMLEQPHHCTEKQPCDSQQLGQYHVYATLTGSSPQQGIPILQQPALCIAASADHLTLQLSWKTQAKANFLRPVSVCEPSEFRMQFAVVVP